MRIAVDRWQTAPAGWHGPAGRTWSRVLKIRLLDYIRCPACRGRLHLEPPPIAGTAADAEVTEGLLTCAACDIYYPVRGGVPRLIRAASMPGHNSTARTAVRFGCLWSHSDPDEDSEPGRPYHFEKMAAALGLEVPRGLVMDAGCGDGVDLSGHADRPGVESIGVELSDPNSNPSYIISAREWLFWSYT